MTTATMRGSGVIRFENDISIFEDSPRLYISNGSDGWEQVEFTAYGNYTEKGCENNSSPRKSLKKNLNYIGRNV